MAKRLISERAAARHVGMRNATFHEMVEAELVPSWTNPITGKVRFSIPALDAWTLTLDDREHRAPVAS